ncbi:MAG TPA: helix-turn-helix transcriptional regulator, partial [Bacteroidia bacterium]|nr:helix-turn-helix transcriptional regulator [Bacteroidia bacterium]
YHDANFELSEFSKAMAMSNSQLYRRTTMLTGLSTNNLLREFRLGKAIALLKTQRFSISQISTDTGFSSPSYFTKCFKERFGLRPMEYIDLLRMS